MLQYLTVKDFQYKDAFRAWTQREWHGCVRTYVIVGIYASDLYLFAHVIMWKLPRQQQQ